MFGILSFGAAFMLAAYQAVLWLQSGVGPSSHLNELLYDFFGPRLGRSWLYAPDGWYGLHKLVSWLINLPLTALLAMLGALAFSLMHLIDEIFGRPLPES